MAKVCEGFWGVLFLNETSNTRETVLCVIKKQYYVLYTSFIDSTFHWKSKQVHNKDFSSARTDGKLFSS